MVIGSQTISLHFVRNQRARRYILRVRPDGSARLTIPRGGSIGFAIEFARKHSAWLEAQLRKQAAEAKCSKAWTAGSTILFRGQLVPLQAVSEGHLEIVRFADQSLFVPLGTEDFRPAVEACLWSLAGKELISRVWQLAGHHPDLRVRRIVVRNQRSRWGSCSVKGTISLNWRLIQAPPAVRDYLILHELMHLREMNHSPRFWRLVEAACPDYQAAESWLDAHSHLLR